MEVVLEAKLRWNSRFSGYFCKAITEECHQQKLGFLENFETIMAALDTFFLEVSAHTESKHQKFFYR